MYSFQKYKIEKPKFKISDRVQIVSKKKIFDSKYTPNWTREIFVINKINYTDPLTYSIKDENNEEISEKFYSLELQKSSF
ncbi:hypothetical protein PGB90_010258 [Kerria lacca]